ncbi:MAG: SCO family protein [Myxococcota bacterium]
MNTKENTIPRRIGELVSSWRFAAFLIALALTVTAFLVIVLILPASATGLGAFATDFKMWCFGFDPATGRLEWGYVYVMLANPLILAGFVYLVWSRDLQRAYRSQRSTLVATATAGVMAACLLAAGLLVAGPNEIEQTELPFPAERLRTAIEPPAFELVDQNGDRLTLESLEGRVVMVTAIYTSCHTACPKIVIQARRALASLPPELRDEVTVVAITLDPENDTPPKLKAAARSHQLAYPEWRLLTGDPDRVNTVLDRFSFSRKLNDETGEIDHANMFVLVDKGGKIAYRLNLGERHENWLSTALRVLAEDGSGGLAERAESRPSVPQQ